MQILDSNDTNTFFHNGRKYVKNFIVHKIGDEAIALYDAYDTRLQLFPATHYSEVQVDGVIHDSQAALMEALSLIVFSKIIGGGNSTQNNTAIYYTNGLLNGEGDITATEVAEWLNSREYAINIGETNTPTIFEFLRAENGGTKKYLFLFLRGKGLWGAAQGANPNIVYSSNFKLISIQTLTPQDLDEDEDTHLNYLGLIEDGNFITVANQTEWAFTGATQQYYFSFTQEETLYFALFIGTPDVYGGNSGNDFSDTDFVITTNSEQQPVAVPTLQQVLSEGSVGRIRTALELRTLSRSGALGSKTSTITMTGSTMNITTNNQELGLGDFLFINSTAKIGMTGATMQINSDVLTIDSEDGTTIKGGQTIVYPLTSFLGGTFFYGPRAATFFADAKYNSTPTLSGLSFAHKDYVDNTANNLVPYFGAQNNVDLGQNVLYTGQAYVSNDANPPTGTTINVFGVFGSGFTTESRSLFVTKDSLGKMSVTNRGSGGVLTNTSFGTLSLLDNTNGSNNTAFGYQTLRRNTSGLANTAVGDSALRDSFSGNSNVAIGFNALLTNIGGERNIGIGRSTLQGNKTGGHNTAMGYQSLATMSGSSYNTAIGAKIMQNSTGGANNTWIGFQSSTSLSINNTTGSFNTFIGGDITFNSAELSASNMVIISDGQGNRILQKNSQGVFLSGGTVSTASDIEITDLSKGLILKAPNGTRYRLSVNNSGALITTAI